jgi:hypothetical protein
MRMKQLWVVCLAIGLLALLTISAAALGSRPSQAIQAPTVTGTPEGPQILVPDKVNVRLGPCTECELIGVLIAGQRAPAIGRTSGGDWIEIVYPGVEGNVAWVYAPLVQVINLGAGSLPIVEPPPTPTPRVTATIDPTLAAQFNLGDGLATRLPTFTPPPPIVAPTLEPTDSGPRGGIPPVLAIAALLVVGGVGTAVSFLRGR